MHIILSAVITAPMSLEKVMIRYYLVSGGPNPSGGPPLTVITNTDTNIKCMQYIHIRIVILFV